MVRTLELKLIGHIFHCIFVFPNFYYTDILTMLLTIVNFDVNVLRNYLKRKTIFHFLKNKKFDSIVSFDVNGLRQRFLNFFC